VRVVNDIEHANDDLSASKPCSRNVIHGKRSPAIEF